MFRRFLLLLFVISALFTLAQNYIAYQKVFNRIDEDVLNAKLTVALVRADSILNNYDFVFAKHCVKVLQICVESEDTLRAQKWLNKCFRQGVPVYFLKNNSITKQVFQYPSISAGFVEREQLQYAYQRNLNIEVKRKIDSLLEIDQKFTRKVNNGFILWRHTIYGLQWIKNNKSTFEALNKIIEQYGFPGEQIIGLDSFLLDSIRGFKYTNFYGPSELREASVQIMLQHYFSIRHRKNKKFESLLYKNLINGNMPAFQYAVISDFMSKGKKNYYKYLAPPTVDARLQLQINCKRDSIGLNTITQNERNHIMQRDSRKEGKANAVIMLE